MLLPLLLLLMRLTGAAPGCCCSRLPPCYALSAAIALPTSSAVPGRWWARCCCTPLHCCHFGLPVKVLAMLLPFPLQSPVAAPLLPAHPLRLLRSLECFPAAAASALLLLSLVMLTGSMTCRTFSIIGWWSCFSCCYIATESRSMIWERGLTPMCLVVSTLLPWRATP
jgi:hypothetical protein